MKRSVRVCKAQSTTSRSPSTRPIVRRGPPTLRTRLPVAPPIARRVRWKYGISPGWNLGTSWQRRSAALSSIFFVVRYARYIRVYIANSLSLSTYINYDSLDTQKYTLQLSNYPRICFNFSMWLIIVVDLNHPHAWHKLGNIRNCCTRIYCMSSLTTRSIGSFKCSRNAQNELKKSIQSACTLLWLSTLISWWLIDHKFLKSPKWPHAT